MGKKDDSNSFKYLPSAKSSHVGSPRIINEVQSQKTNDSIYHKFVTFLSNQHISLLKKKLLEFRGTHNPIKYKQSFNFQQRWEKVTKSAEQGNFNVIMSDSRWCYYFSFLVMIFNFMLIWFLSVLRFYEITHSKAFFLVAMIFVLADLLLKVYLYIEHYKSNHDSIKPQQIFINIEFLGMIFGDLWCVIYYAIMMAENELSNLKNVSMVPFDLVTIIILANRAFDIYNYLVILIIATKYKNEMTIFDLIIKMICILHIFSLILYGVTLTSPQSNWMTRISMEDNQWNTRYIYTLYFACTTLFTVGYGDILPTNKIEIITIMCIEALGMALFGYIVNEVGVTLGNMRKRRTNLEKDIYNSERIARLYELSPDLGKKVRDYVISNQIAQQQLGISEENDFLLKLNEELRQQVKQSHQLKIIKTSIFFITHWSKKIQIQMAKKLQKVIFAPNQNIHARGQIDRLFVMVKGKIEVYTQKKFGTKICCRKLLKTIQKNPGQQVFNNVYGFTSFFSGKQNRLKAIAKQSTICYTLGYEDIRDSINEDSNDFEYFHYLRQKFQFSKIPQLLQAPNILNIRENYSPVIYYVIKKYNRANIKQNRHRSWTRRDYVNRFVCQVNYGKNINEILAPETYEDASSQSSNNQQSETNQNDNQVTQTLQRNGSRRMDRIMSHSQISKQNQIFIEMINKSNQYISNRSYRRKYCHTQKEQRYEEKAKLFLEQNVTLTSEFEIGKNYNRFYQNSNKINVIEKLNKKPELIQEQCLKNNKNLLKSYPTSFRKTLRKGTY